MRKLEISAGTGTSTILVGESIKNAESYIKESKVIIITDENLNRLYKDHFPSSNVIVIGTGEKIKTLDTLKYIYEKLISFEVDRSSFILGIGGGIVCDITGFAASTYMRGVKFGFVSTSLLSQVDASVGGKNGVNFNGLKNMVGVFNQPEFVICDTELLKTLPPEELNNGFAEIIKHALIKDSSYFSYLETNREAAMALEPEVIEKIVFDSVKIKADVVVNDEREAGERKKLNFGHTIGHAMELTDKIAHGRAVSIGMVFAAGYSQQLGYLSSEDVERIKNLLISYNLPVAYTTSKQDVKQQVQMDKKRSNKAIHFVLLKKIGEAVLKKITFDELEQVIDTVYVK